MINRLYEDSDILVAIKPPGLESQSSKTLAPDMVSEIRRYLSGQSVHKLSTERSTQKKNTQPPYVGVIHRLDKPVGGIMVYAKHQKAAAALSASLQAGEMDKWYQAVVCGKPVENTGEYVDYLRQDRKTNCSQIVDKSDPEGKKARLAYEVKQVIRRETEGELSLVEIHLLTGRHHQIRVQFSGHGTPLFGDERYGKKREAGEKRGRRESLALFACRLSFPHPRTGERMEFEKMPEDGAFRWFRQP